MIYAVRCAFCTDLIEMLTLPRGQFYCSLRCYRNG